MFTTEDYNKIIERSNVQLKRNEKEKKHNILVRQCCLVLFVLYLLLIAKIGFSQDAVLLNSNNVGAFSITKIAGDSAIAAMNTKSFLLFNQIANKTITGTSETSLKGQIWGTDTIKPASVFLGKAWSSKVSGAYKTPVVSVGTITINIYLSNVVIASMVIGNLPLNVSSYQAYQSEINLACTAVGSSGNVTASGSIMFNTLSAGVPLIFILNPVTTPIDWTVNKVYDAKILYSASGNTLTTSTQILSSLN